MSSLCFLKLLYIYSLRYTHVTLVNMRSISCYVYCLSKSLGCSDEFHQSPYQFIFSLSVSIFHNAYKHCLLPHLDLRRLESLLLCFPTVLALFWGPFINQKDPNYRKDPKIPERPFKGHMEIGFGIWCILLTVAKSLENKGVMCRVVWFFICHMHFTSN